MPSVSTRSFTLRRMGIDGFLLAIIAVIVLAYFFPQPGIATKPFSLEKTGAYGMSLIFFFYGLKLNMERFAAALKNWRVHTVIQLTTFIIFPLIALLIEPLLGSEHELLWLSIFYLCVLPSTVSSSVVMVSIAGGNIPSAIFNASISTLAGVFITPLWMMPYLKSGNSDFNSADIIFKLVLQVLVPVVLGLLLHKYWGNYAEKYKRQLRYFDQSIIVLIIYTSFCHSFYNHAFDGFSIALLLELLAGLTTLFFIVFFLIRSVSRSLQFNHKDTITVLFCGSKKSLVHGTVMSKVLFPASATVSVILLPLMLYHALQLIFAGIIAQRMAGNNTEKGVENVA
jgi:solute carrier family 10 (sodium/bile acid cotransporter), member 7